MGVHTLLRIFTYFAIINSDSYVELKSIMSHYTLGWHDQKNEHHEIGEYAEDAFEAAKFAREDIPYLHEHPFSLDSIKKEE